MRPPWGTVLLIGFRVGFAVALAAQRTLDRVPGVAASRSRLLDTMLGPAEDFEYVSRTTPLD